MKTFKIVTRSTMWSTLSLTREVEELLPQMIEKGYTVVSVSFGMNIWWMPTAYITISKEKAFTNAKSKESYSAAK